MDDIKIKYVSPHPVWYHEPTFLERNPWFIPVVISVAGILGAIIFVCICKHRHCLSRRRQPRVVVVRGNPGGTTTHIAGNYPVGTTMNPYYTGVVVQSTQNGSTVIGNYPAGTPTVTHYPGVNNYPPPYSVPVNINPQQSNVIYR